jgi:hypothetical protein
LFYKTIVKTGALFAYTYAEPPEGLVVEWQKGVVVLAVEFLLSRDGQFLDQYYALRQRCFRKELGLVDFDGAEEDQDRQGRILLAIQDGKCVGGVRISRRVSLPSQMETLNINQDTCCMWERFAIDPDVRSVSLIRQFIAQLIVVSRESGYQHAMVLSSLCNARFYRRCLSSLEVGFEIHRHVPHCAQGAFAGLEHYMSVAYLDDSQALSIAV